MANGYCHSCTQSFTSSFPIRFSSYSYISVTPILSRIAEKLIVKQWLRPSTPVDSTVDQYAFKPTGSTTCALVSLIHDIVNVLLCSMLHG